MQNNSNKPEIINNEILNSLIQECKTNIIYISVGCAMNYENFKKRDNDTKIDSKSDINILQQYPVFLKNYIEKYNYSAALILIDPYLEKSPYCITQIKDNPKIEVYPLNYYFCYDKVKLDFKNIRDKLIIFSDFSGGNYFQLLEEYKDYDNILIGLDYKLGCFHDLQNLKFELLDDLKVDKKHLITNYYTNLLKLTLFPCLRKLYFVDMSNTGKYQYISTLYTYGETYIKKYNKNISKALDYCWEDIVDILKMLKKEITDYKIYTDGYKWYKDATNMLTI